MPACLSLLMSGRSGGRRLVFAAALGQYVRFF